MMTAPDKIPTHVEPVEANSDGAQMSFFEHLDELRSRLIKVFLVLILALLVASFVTEPVLKYLSGPCECDLVLLKPTDSVVMYFRVALLLAGIITVPYATYHLLMFILPGLTPREKRMVLTALPTITLLFLTGVAFAWFIMVPAALPFLRNFMSSVFRAEWTANEYIAFLTSLLFWMGVAFEMPALFFLLGRLGIIEPGLLIRNWRLAVVIMTIIAAVITPTVDPFNMMLVTAPLLVLYALSIFMTAVAYRQRIAFENQELER